MKFEEKKTSQRGLEGRFVDNISKLAQNLAQEVGLT